MSSLLQKLTGRSEPSKTPLPALSEEQMNQITEAVTTALENKIRAQNNYYLDETLEAVHKRLGQWTTHTTSDLNSFRRFVSESIDKMKMEIYQIAQLVEEMTTGEGKPNAELMALAARVQDLERLCESHSIKLSALQLQGSKKSSKP